MISDPCVRSLRAASTFLLAAVTEAASQARFALLRAQRRGRRRHAGGQAVDRLPGAAARLPRPLEVVLHEASEPPSYTVWGDIRIYGLGPPQRLERPRSEPVRDLVRRLTPSDAEELRARVDDAASLRGYADVVFEADAWWDVSES